MFSVWSSMFIIKIMTIIYLRNAVCNIIHIGINVSIDCYYYVVQVLPLHIHFYLYLL